MHGKIAGLGGGIVDEFVDGEPRLQAGDLGRSLKQMSREFETPVGTIKRRLHVARLRLKAVLEGNTPHGIDEPAVHMDSELMTAV